MKQTPRRRPQTSRTLMRHAVKQPGKLKSSPVKTTRQVSRRPVAAIVPKASVSSIEPNRLLHAKSVKKSRAISRFSSSVFSYEANPVVTLISQSPKPRATSAAPKRPTTDLLERAIQQADSHKQKPHRPARRLGRYLHKLRPAAS